MGGLEWQICQGLHWGGGGRHWRARREQNNKLMALSKPEAQSNESDIHVRQTLSPSQNARPRMHTTTNTGQQLFSYLPPNKRLHQQTDMLWYR